MAKHPRSFHAFTGPEELECPQCHLSGSKEEFRRKEAAPKDGSMS